MFWCFVLRIEFQGCVLRIVFQGCVLKLWGSGLKFYWDYVSVFCFGDWVSRFLIVIQGCVLRIEFQGSGLCFRVVFKGLCFKVLFWSCISRLVFEFWFQGRWLCFCFKSLVEGGESMLLQGCVSKLWSEVMFERCALKLRSDVGFWSCVWRLLLARLKEAAGECDLEFCIHRTQTYQKGDLPLQFP